MAWPAHDQNALIPDKRTRHVNNQFDANLQGYLSEEHADDGTHTTVTADAMTITQQDSPAMDWVTLQVALSNGTTMPVAQFRAIPVPALGNSPSRYQFQIAGIGAQDISITTAGTKLLGLPATVQMNLGVLITSIYANTEQQIYESASVMHRLAFPNQVGSYSIAGTDANAFEDNSVLCTPEYTVYSMLSGAANNICGIKATDPTIGGHGQLLIAFNDSAFVITLQHETTAPAWKRLQCPGGVNVGINPGGGFVALYRMGTMRWHVLLTW